jgi:geranylgeranyl pyrophosphate synthase
MNRPAAALTLVEPRDLARLAEAFRTALPLAPGTEPHLAGVVEDVLAHPGSLARAQLAYAVLAELRFPRRRARELATALELFHTASLLFDDLPAMDDARERRGQPCPHVRHGEAAAMLGALGLITRAYQLLWQSFGLLPRERAAQASELVAHCLGVAGILNGQAEDLHFASLGAAGADATARVERVAEGKTVTLVRLSLVLPALVGGSSADEIASLERLSRTWGLAYQGLDDAKDGLLASAETGKSTARDGLLGRPNLPAAAGWDAALERLAGHLDGARAAIAELTARRPGWARPPAGLGASAAG